MKARTQVSGQAGWIPLPRFCEKAAGVGFVDFSTTVVPLLETYQSRTVKSLTVCCIELATGKQAIIEPGRSLGYDGTQIHSISTSIGPIRAHRFFVYALKGVYEQLST